MVTAAQMENYRVATEASLLALRQRSTRIMRATAGYMLTVLIVTLLMEDTAAATFINYVVLGTAAAAAIMTELWSRKGSRAAMILASLLIQAGAIVFFFTALPLLTLVLENVMDELVHYTRVDRYASRVSLLLAVLPMAGALAAWHQYRAFAQIKQQESKRGPVRN